MIELGLDDLQIGSIASIGLIVQVALALLGGAITDRLGRKLTTFIFDILSLSVPAVIWAVARDYRYFLAAAIFNGMWRITSTSWTCLMVEDTNPNHLVHFFSWIYIAGLVSAFFAPIAGLFVNRFGLVLAVRGLYLFAAVMIILGTTPFGWIAGSLSESNRILPFLLNLGLFACGAVLILLTTRRNERADFKVQASSAKSGGLVHRLSAGFGIRYA